MSDSIIDINLIIIANAKCLGNTYERFLDNVIFISGETRNQSLVRLS